MDKYHLKCKNFKLKFLSFLFSKTVKNSKSIADRREKMEFHCIYSFFPVKGGKGGTEKKRRKKKTQ